jgi:hypothetical protein
MSTGACGLLLPPPPPPLLLLLLLLLLVVVVPVPPALLHAARPGPCCTCQRRWCSIRQPPAPSDKVQLQPPSNIILPAVLAVDAAEVERHALL